MSLITVKRKKRKSKKKKVEVPKSLKTKMNAKEACGQNLFQKAKSHNCHGLIISDSCLELVNKYINEFLGVFTAPSCNTCICEDNDHPIILPCICRATTRPPRPSSTAECLRLIARLRGEQASAASWEPRPPFEAAEMD